MVYVQTICLWSCKLLFFGRIWGINFVLYKKEYKNIFNKLQEGEVVYPTLYANLIRDNSFEMSKISTTIIGW